MRNPERIDEMLKVIKMVWKTNPDLRLGQLIDNANILAGGHDIFYTEDDTMKKGLLSLLNHEPQKG